MNGPGSKHAMVPYGHVNINEAIYRVAVASLVLAVVVTSQEAAASSSNWRSWSRSLLALHSHAWSDSSSQTGLKLLAQTQSSSLAVGSRLRAYDQCGGAGGLCNQTTIGIPCGDYAWTLVFCPANFTCKRMNSKYWQCQLMPGKTPPADATIMNATVAMTVLPTTPETGSTTSLQEAGNTTASSSSSSTNTSSSRDGEPVQAHPDEPIVPVCGPGSMPGQSAMCAKTQTRYILSPDQVAGAAAATSAAADKGRSDSSLSAYLLQLLSIVLAVGLAVAGQ